MKAALLAIAAIAVISLAAWAGLHQIGFSAAQATSSPDVRLD